MCPSLIYLQKGTREILKGLTCDCLLCFKCVFDWFCRFGLSIVLHMRSVLKRVFISDWIKSDRPEGTLCDGQGANSVTIELCFAWLSVTFWVDSRCQNARCGCVRFRRGAIGRQARLRNQRHNNSHHPALRGKKICPSQYSDYSSKIPRIIHYVPCCTFNIHEHSQAITSLFTFLVTSSKIYNVR